MIILLQRETVLGTCKKKIQDPRPTPGPGINNRTRITNLWAGNVGRNRTGMMSDVSESRIAMWKHAWLKDYAANAGLGWMSECCVLAGFLSALIVGSPCERGSWLSACRPVNPGVANSLAHCSVSNGPRGYLVHQIPTLCRAFWKCCYLTPWDGNVLK